MFLRMYIADHLIEELSVFPNLLPTQQHRELYIKEIVAGLKEKHKTLTMNLQQPSEFFLEGVSSKMNKKIHSKDGVAAAEMKIAGALKRKRA